MDLPVRSDDLKVCAYKKQLFLLSVPSARAYLFNGTTKHFAKVDLSAEICAMLTDVFTLFCYKDEIYLKGTVSAIQWIAFVIFKLQDESSLEQNFSRKR